MVGPEAFFEVRYLQHHKQDRALDRIPQLAAEFKAQFGRDSGGLIRSYRCDDAETIVVALGSLVGTVKDAVDEARAAGSQIGVVSICSFRPFPLKQVRAALQSAKRVVVLEKCLAVGIGGIVSDGVRKSLSGIQLKGYTVIAGLGGRPITKRSLLDLFASAARDELQELNFLDLNWDVVHRELERGRQQRRAGPTAENILRDVGVTGARVA
jgi:pyruvate ferredoxin oxidoreductase alpha subunit